jgi:hypothetical protein
MFSERVVTGCINHHYGTLIFYYLLPKFFTIHYPSSVMDLGTLEPPNRPFRMLAKYGISRVTENFVVPDVPNLAG